MEIKDIQAGQGKIDEHFPDDPGLVFTLHRAVCVWRANQQGEGALWQGNWHVTRAGSGSFGQSRFPTSTPIRSEVPQSPKVPMRILTRVLSLPLGSKATFTILPSPRRASMLSPN